MPVSNERLEELRKLYRDLAAQPSRKAIGYSDLEHAEIMEELIHAREIFADLELGEEEARRQRERNADAEHNGGLSPLGNAIVELDAEKGN